MKIKNVNKFGIAHGILREGSKNTGVDLLLPIFKRFLNYLNVPWVDTCCNDTGTAEAGGSVYISDTMYDTNADAVTALGVGKLYKSTTLINGSPIILITV